ncbi:hypothetical protein DFR68_103685 [Nocardia mexicana]|uniref:Uncharacterized protein n=1 Tax=Nocardia mexicana TaxID=279262 RepID=A0A370H9F0_9NOCA|nr:hypothetical protein DFR68_103685 [Nocardia mexicana]
MAEFTTTRNLTTQFTIGPRGSHGRPVRNMSRRKEIHAGRIDRTPIHRPLRIPGRR